MTIFIDSEKRKGRWGKKFVDKRDWKAYNEELVVRGKFYLDFDWVKNWDKELEKMNKGKRGSPFEFPESLIKLQGVWQQWIDYRGIEGITRKLAEYGLVPYYNDFSTINRRVNKLEIEFELPKEDSVNVSCDGSGMKMTNGGAYRERKYGKKRKKYIKVTITADPKKKKLLDVDVSIEGEGDSEPDIAEKHMRRFMKEELKINKFWGDGSFDDIDLFEFLHVHDIDDAIKTRKDATINSTDPPNRRKSVEERKKRGYKKWARKKKYGQRWTGTEGIFSAVKRKFGEDIRSTKLVNILLEAKRKFWAYDLIQQYAKV